MRYKKVMLTIFVLCFMASFAIALAPSGVNPTEVNSTSAPADAASSEVALAGNVSELTLTGFSNTQSWQGYYGNVSGTIQLANSADQVFYNWSLTSPSGEVYASENSSINWTGTACATNATDTPILETAFNIASDDVDGVDETFYDTWANDHDGFYVNNIEIAADTCNLSTKVFGDTGAGVDTEFEEVILKGGSGEYIFAAILEETSVLGFDARDHDFQMLVLEDGHGTDTATRPYYFWVELE